MAGGYMGAFSGGNNPDYLQQLLAQQKAGVPFSAAGAAPAAQAPIQESPASLSARYGTSPETVDQWRAMNGYQAPQPVNGLGGANPLATPLGPTGPREIPGNPVTPTAQATPGNPYFDLINKAWDAQSKRAEDSARSMWASSQADRGMLPADAAAQDAYGRAMGQVTEQMATGRAGALADAQGRWENEQFARQQAAQEQTWRQQQFEWQKQQAAQQQQMQQQQFDWQRQQQQNQLDWAKQQQTWQTEDRNRQMAGANPYDQLTGGASSGAAQDPAAQRALALIMGGSGGRSPSEVLGGGGGAPLTSTGQEMGGGAGLTGGAAQPGGSGFGKPFGGFTGGHVWDGVDRSVGYNRNQPKGFEGPATSTVGSALNGPTTTGSGTSTNPYANAINNAVNTARQSPAQAPGGTLPTYQTSWKPGGR